MGAFVGLHFSNRLLEAVEREQPDVVSPPTRWAAPISKKPMEKESALFRMNA